MLRSPPDRCNAYVVIDCGNLRQRSSVAWDMGASPSWSSDDIHCLYVFSLFAFLCQQWACFVGQVFDELFKLMLCCDSTVDDTSVSVRLTCRSSHIEREPVPGSPKGRHS